MQYRPFSSFSSSVPVLKLGMSKDEESKASKVLLGSVFTWECKEIIYYTPVSYPQLRAHETRRDIGSPNSGV